MLADPHPLTLLRCDEFYSLGEPWILDADTVLPGRVWPGNDERRALKAFLESGSKDPDDIDRAAVATKVTDSIGVWKITSKYEGL